VTAEGTAAPSLSLVLICLSEDEARICKIPRAIPEAAGAVADLGIVLDPALSILALMNWMQRVFQLAPWAP